MCIRDRSINTPKSIYLPDTDWSLHYEDNQYDKTPNTMYLPASTLVERLKERKCELCGVMGDLVMHHVRNINQLKADTRWNAVMIKRHCKTLAVCQDCDALIHKNYDQ